MSETWLFSKAKRASEMALNFNVLKVKNFSGIWNALCVGWEVMFENTHFHRENLQPQNFRTKSQVLINYSEITTEMLQWFPKLSFLFHFFYCCSRNENFQPCQNK